MKAITVFGSQGSSKSEISSSCAYAGIQRIARTMKARLYRMLTCICLLSVTFADVYAQDDMAQTIPEPIVKSAVTFLNQPPREITVGYFCPNLTLILATWIQAIDYRKLSELETLAAWYPILVYAVATMDGHIPGTCVYPEGACNCVAMELQNLGTCIQEADSDAAREACSKEYDRGSQVCMQLFCEESA